MEKTELEIAYEERGERILQLQREIGEMNQQEYNSLELFCFCSHCKKLNDARLTATIRRCQVRRLLDSEFIQVGCDGCGALLLQAKKAGWRMPPGTNYVEYFPKR